MWKPEEILEWKRDIAAREEMLKNAKNPRQIENLKKEIATMQGFVSFLENGPSISEVKS